MRFKKDAKAKSNSDKEDKAKADVKIVDEADDVSLHASSQDSLMVEVTSGPEEKTPASNGNTDEPQAPQTSEKPEAEPHVTQPIVETTDENTPSTTSNQTDKDLPPSHTEVDQASCSTSNKDDAIPREGGKEADDAEVILIVDSPSKEDVPQPRALEQIERAVRNLKSAFVQGEQELAELARAMSRLKEERGVNEELLHYKRGGYHALKTSVEEGAFSRSTKRAKIEEEFLKEVQENFNAELKRFEGDISTLESEIRNGKEKEKSNRTQSEILQGMFLNYSRTYEELMGRQ